MTSMMPGVGQARAEFWLCSWAVLWLIPALGNAAPPMAQGHSLEHWLAELDSDDGERSGKAVAPLVEIGEAALSEIIKRLEASPPEVRGRAIRVVHGMGRSAKRAVPALIACLKSEHYFHRGWSSQALGDLGEDASDAVPALVESLRDWRHSSRRHGLQALCKIGKAAVPALLELLEGEDAGNFATGEAVSALVDMDPDCLSMVKPQLWLLAAWSHDLGVRRGATAALNKLLQARPEESVKPHVDSSASGGFVVRGNGLPDHKIGEFPNKNCPNKLRLQVYDFSSPYEPQPANAPIEIQDKFLFGVAENQGVPFDPWMDRFWQSKRDSGWRYNVLARRAEYGLDENNGYVHQDGSYRYHGAPAWFIPEPGGQFGGMHLVGRAADGHFIFNGLGHDDPRDVHSKVRKLRSSYQLKKGERPEPPIGPGGVYDGTFVEDYEYVPNSGDLDQCNGREGVHTRFGDRVSYHYHITEEFPFVPLFFHSQPDKSFQRTGD